MSAQSLGQFLLFRMRELGMSNSQVAQLAGISRQTWYNLVNADIKEARFSTLLKICQVLELHPMDVMSVYFSESKNWSRNKAA